MFITQHQLVWDELAGLPPSLLKAEVDAPLAFLFFCRAVYFFFPFSQLKSCSKRPENDFEYLISLVVPWCRDGWYLCT